MVVKPSIGFLELDTDAQLVKDAEAIVKAMTNNANYPSPTPTLDSLTTAINAFSTAMDNAADGGKTLTLIKNQKRTALCGVLRKLASYVHVACDGDLAVLTSSGFPTWKPNRTPVGPLPTPAAPVLSLGTHSGEMFASTPPIANSLLYTWRVALASAPDAYLIQEQTSAASDTFEGLTPGQTYVVDVNVIGTAGPTDFSDTAEQMVL